MQASQEALEVAEALVLLPGVDSVTPGRQLFTRAAAKDLQVSLSHHGPSVRGPVHLEQSKNLMCSLSAAL